MCDGFSQYEGDSVRWIVWHDHGADYVYAKSEAIALQRFLARYPDYVVHEIKRA